MPTVVHVESIPDFAHIRKIRDRQVLIVRDHDQDEDGKDRDTICLSVDLHAGARASMKLAYPNESKRDECWAGFIAGDNDEGIGQFIDEQESMWGGKIMSGD